MEGYISVIDENGQVTKNSPEEKALNLQMPRSVGPGLKCVEV